MSKYHLSEAYSHLYNPRKIDESFYDNLRFVDYLLDEEIEEVVESIYWEFRDYGNTVDESFELIDFALSDNVLCETLLEATVTFSADRPSSGSARVTTAAGRTRGDARKARVYVAKKKVERAVRSGVDRAKSAASAVKGAVSKEAQKAKAGLMGVLRKGARKAGSLTRRAGERIERSGESARRAAQISASDASYTGRPRSGESYAVSASRARSAALSQAQKSGSKRRAIGSAIKELGKKLFRAGAQSTTRPQGPKAPPAQGPRRPYNAQDTTSSSGAMSSNSGSSGNSSTPRLGLERLGRGGGKSVVTFNRSAMKRVVPIDSRGRELTGATRSTLVRSLRQKNLQNEDLEILTQYILEDLISEGYADTFEGAITILNNLSEDVVGEIALDYLQG